MNKDTTPAAIQRARRRVDAAISALREAVAATYPVGARVTVIMGNATIEGVVTGYGPSWSNRAAADVYIRNVKTGKERCFGATYHQVLEVRRG